MERRSTNPEKEKENHLIEAIVFTTDFLSFCDDSKNKVSKKGSRWICGGDCASEIGEERYENENEIDNDIEDGEGWFGLKKKQLISYENSEDLSRKLDALFYHRQRSPFARSTTPEVRDDDEDDCGERHTKNDDDDCFYRDLQRRIDEVISTSSTCPSTNPSRSWDESNRWSTPSSTWDSFACHGNSREPRGVTPLRDATRNHPHGRPLQTATKARRNSSRRKRSHQRAPETALSHGRTTFGNSGSISEPSPLPDFLRDTQFKSTGSYHLPVIDLPPSRPTSFSSASDRGRSMAHTLGDETAHPNARTRTMDSRMVVGVSTKKGPLRGDHGARRCGFLRDAVCRRRFGRRTKHYWEKARRFLRR